MEKITTQSKVKNILYVDADKDLVRDLKDYLKHHEIQEKYGLNFIFVDSVKEALKKIQAEKIDLVVLEILLPIINGYYLLKTLKREAGEMPIILYTRLKGPQDLAKMASFEVDNIFLKQLMKIEDLIRVVVSEEDTKVELDKVLLELQSQVKSISDSEVKTDLKVTQCPRCHMILTHDSHFCNNCGQKIFKKAKPKAPTRAVGPEGESEVGPESDIQNTQVAEDANDEIVAQSEAQIETPKVEDGAATEQENSVTEEVEKSEEAQQESTNETNPPKLDA